MNETLRLTLIQTALEWENADANLRRFSEKINAVSGRTDLVVLPEMFSTGFSMAAQTLAEKPDGKTFRWLTEQAKRHQTAITGSVIIDENGKFFNRLFFVFPSGEFKKYDKKHRFTFAGEDRVFSPGNERLVVKYKGWKICPLICYDLRFPVWARNTVDYDLLLFVANWPKTRINAWDALLKARAIENLSYCAGVNRTGIDGNGHEYSGHSAIYDVLGEQISTSDFENEFTETLLLEKAHLQKWREKLRFLDDRDDFILK